MISLRTALFGFTALGLAACATPPAGPDYSDLTPRQQQLMIALASFSGVYDVSEAAMATAVLNDAGKPVGLMAYEDPSAAIRAADTAAFIAAIRTGAVNKDDVSAFPAIVLSIDDAAAGNYQLAL